MLIYEQFIALTCSGMFHPLYPARHCFISESRWHLALSLFHQQAHSFTLLVKEYHIFLMPTLISVWLCLQFNFFTVASPTLFLFFFHAGPSLSFCKILAPTPAKSICSESARGCRFYCAFCHPYAEGLFSKVVELEECKFFIQLS